jgi:YgiT-type zinc finger domain-containing protein
MKKCFVCGHGVVNHGMTNEMLEDNGHFIIVKDVPCLVCANCGEIYLETDVMRTLEGLLSRNISELEVVNYKSVA